MNIKHYRFLLFIFLLILVMLCSGCSRLGEAIPSDSFLDEHDSLDSQYADEIATENVLTNDIIAFDNGALSISIAGLELVENSLVSTMQIRLCNCSPDVYYEVEVTGLAVDGVQFSEIPKLDRGFFYGCQAGETDTVELILCNYPDNDTFFQRLEMNDIELTFDIKADGSTVQSSVHVYPNGQNASGTYTLQTKDDLTVLLDNSYARITMVRCHKTEIYDYGFIAQLYVENKTDVLLNLYPSAAYLNGISLYPEKCGINIEPSKSIVWDILWPDETVRGHDFDSIDTVSLDLVFTEGADRSNEPFLYQNITFVPLMNNDGL